MHYSSSLCIMALKDSFKIKSIVAITIMVHLEVSEAGLRILGGRDALKDEFPFAVRLEQQHTWTFDGKTHFEYHRFCSGAAITPTWILTAAHCEDDIITKAYDGQLITARPKIFARYNSYFPHELGQLSLITKVISHPGWAYNHGRSTFRFRITYDIALCQTENISVSVYGKISATDYKSLVGHEALLLGFGGTNATPTEKPLQVLKAMFIKCDIREGLLYGFLCVVPRCGQEATACGGDSGGPVIHASGIAGVISSGYGNCNQYGHTIFPGYTSARISMISHAIDWISNIVASKTNQ